MNSNHFLGGSKSPTLQLRHQQKEPPLPIGTESYPSYSLISIPPQHPPNFGYISREINPAQKDNTEKKLTNLQSLAMVLMDNALGFR
jgi:hypothetical protein